MATQVRTPGDRSRVETLQIVVREETPFLPKVAFTLITLASMAGVTLTSSGMGLLWWQIAVRWLTLWSLALAGGFLVWRLIYLRRIETDVDPDALDALNGDALRRADRLARWLAVTVVAGAPGALVVPFWPGADWLRGALVLGSVLVAGLLLLGVSTRRAAVPAAILTGLTLLLWSWADAGDGWPLLVRIAHLSAFSLWVGGALWNIGVAMPAGRRHANLDAVLAGARQLDRFRWVVRVALPTIIVTGLVMANAYRALPLSWWLTFPGLLVPLKALAIVALVVVFITCPLFRHCSPVQGVCDLDDLNDLDASPSPRRSR